MRLEENFEASAASSNQRLSRRHGVLGGQAGADGALGRPGYSYLLPADCSTPSPPSNQIRLQCLAAYT